ncbi:hypothetical protein TYRP_020796 [Tyrophagus putrescentiae]|nr:hypothetical protein TYRP_020796 [Tyrophagus putrescentiae]
MLTQSRRSHSYNVPSGTVVDRSIVEPFYDAFYLNSHFSLQNSNSGLLRCAYRSKLHLKGQLELQLLKGSSSQKAFSKEQIIISQLNNDVKIHKRICNSLYYC